MLPISYNLTWTSDIRDDFDGKDQFFDVNEKRKTRPFFSRELKVWKLITFYVPGVLRWNLYRNFCHVIYFFVVYLIVQNDRFLLKLHTYEKKTPECPSHVVTPVASSKASEIIRKAECKMCTCPWMKLNENNLELKTPLILLNSRNNLLLFYSN